MLAVGVTADADGVRAGRCDEQVSVQGQVFGCQQGAVIACIPLRLQFARHADIGKGDVAIDCDRRVDGIFACF